jgi:transposase
MARPARGKEALEVAKKFLETAQTANELRICQAVIFPLELKMTTAETAACIGRSVTWTTRNRNAFIKQSGFPVKPGPGGRKRENMSPEEEKEFLKPFFDKARTGGILIVGEIHQALEKKLGRKAALASAYNLLHRNGWRKLAPDKRHVDADAEVQANWKKNSRRS